MILGPETLVLRSLVNFGTLAQKGGGGIGKIPNCFDNQFGTLLDVCVCVFFHLPFFEVVAPKTFNFRVMVQNILRTTHIAEQYLFYMFLQFLAFLGPKWAFLRFWIRFKIVFGSTHIVQTTFIFYVSFNS